MVEMPVAEVVPPVEVVNFGRTSDEPLEVTREAPNLAPALEPTPGLEPGTPSLRGKCSTS